MRLLLIEDDRNLAAALAQVLSSSYTIDVAYTGEAALAKANTQDYSLIILDLTLPDMSGLDVCRQLRHRPCIMPILVLSGESKVLSKISLLDAGADDYMTKPFSLGELKVRLRSLHRRANTHSIVPDRLCVGDLTLDKASFLVQRGGYPIKLRRKEFALLECLMKHAGMVVTREILTDYAWGHNETPWTNTVDVHIKYLRDKIDRPFTQPLIKTVHGLGYRLEASPQKPVPKNVPASDLVAMVH